MRDFADVRVEVTSRIPDFGNEFVLGGAFREELGGLSNEVVQFVGLGHRWGHPTDKSQGKGASRRRCLVLGSELGFESFQERWSGRGDAGAPRWRNPGEWGWNDIGG
jgi:hypothetical protein